MVEHTESALADPTRPTAPTDEASNREHELDFRQRMWALATGCVLLGLLLTARILGPSPNGMGTHQQLGLPPCTFVGMFGMRCPTCGMTTSWSYFTRLQFANSWQANPGGLCLAAIALIAGIYAVTAAIRARYRAPLNAKWSLILTLAITALTLFDWVSRF